MPKRGDDGIRVFNVFWYGKPVAVLTYDNGLWMYDQKIKMKMSLSDKRGVEGTPVPFYLEALLPEVKSYFRREDKASERVLSNPLSSVNAKTGTLPSIIDRITMSDRFASNVTVIESGDPFDLIVDYHQGDLRQYCGTDGTFMGQLKIFTEREARDAKRAIEMSFKRRESPKLSGAQAKAPVCLTKAGVLLPAIGNPFTHIIKLPGFFDDDLYNTLGSVEFYSMSMARAAGVHCEDFAVADVPGIGISFIAERFDIPLEGSSELLMLEDSCAATSRISQDKYAADMLEVADLVLRTSTNINDDARMLLRQTVASWCLGNSDMHLKNISMIKTSSGFSDFESVRLSPAYDMVCAMVYPGSAQPDAALPINREAELNLANFLFLARAMNIGESEALVIVTDTCTKIVMEATPMVLRMPPCIQNDKMAMTHIRKASYIMHHRAREVLEDCVARMDGKPTKRPKAKP